MDLQDFLNHGLLTIESLTANINELPFVPTRIRNMGLFAEQPINSTIALIGLSNSKLTLVPNVPRGSPAQVKGLDGKTARPFQVPHLPQRSTVMADSLQGARTFGASGQSEADSAARRVQALNVKHRRDLDFTIEYHRLGAIRGLVLDSDGSVMFDLYDEFGVTQPSEDFALATDTTKVLTKTTSVKRKIEAALDGIVPAGIHAFVGKNWFDKFVSHPKVERAYERYQEGAKLRTDNRSGFEFGGIVFEEYQGDYGGVVQIDPDKGYAFPIGVPDMFITRFAPADYIETVNTDGLPYYSKVGAMPFNKGVQMESQSNPLNLNTRPGAVVELTTN